MAEGKLRFVLIRGARGLVPRREQAPAPGGGREPHPTFRHNDATCRCVSVGRAPREGAGRGAPVAESAAAPPGPIPNPVVTRRSAGEYSGGDPMGGEAAAGAPRPAHAPEPGRGAGRPASTRGGAAAARWAHNPKAGGSNPPPATTTRPERLTPARGAAR